MVLKPLEPDTPLESRQKRFVKNMIRTGKIGDSAVRAGYSAPEYGSFLMKQPKIQRAIERAMETAGITDELLASKLKDGLEATTPAKYAKDGACLVDEHPDHLNRRGYQDMAHRIRGDYAPDRLEVSDKTIVININVGTLKGLVDSGAITDVEAEEVINLPPEAVKQVEDAHHPQTNRPELVD